MRSQLTYHVFRQILRNEPLSFSGCSYRSIWRRWQWKVKYVQNPSRSLFGFSQKSSRESKPQSVDPGFGKMMILSNLLSQNVRPPPPSEIAQAFRDYFKFKFDKPMMIEEIQSSIVTTAFKYLQEKGQELKGFGLSLEDLELALHALRRVYKPENQRRMELAKLLFEEFKKRTDSDEEISEKVGFANHALKHYICILSRCGESLAAREVLLRHEKYSPVHHQASKWQDVRNGFAKEKNEEELRRTTDYMQERGIIHKSHKLEVNIQSCIGMDDLRGAKKWYVCCIDAGIPLAIRTSCSILKLCILRGDLGWGQPIIEEILERPDKEAWDIIFQWAAVKGRGVEEIERMMEVMVRRNQERSNDERPDIDTINGLVELANRANDSYTAERYIALAQNWSIPLNGRTFLLQFDYRLKTGDIHGARSAYTQLQAHEAPEKEDIQLANKLILALCKAKRPDYAMIMQHVEDLSERNARFEPEVVSALCQIHLARNELHDVIDLLKTHTFHYDMQERNSIRKIFVKFCLDRSNNTSSAWDVYSIARQIFNEMDINTRIKLMDEFFARKRSDMGIHVFGHMRQQSVKRGRPNTEAYARCFEGIAKNEDYESLEIVHNMLKLDSEVEPDTRVYNGLMLAYTACGEPYRGLEFWDDIQYSQEGPTYNSICIAFRACELSPHGDQQAREIWSKLQKFEIEVTKDIYDAYVGALAGHGLGKEVISLINQMKEEIGCPPDVSTLGAFYNLSPGDTKKLEVESWAQEAYPAAWRDVQALGQIQTKEGNMLFKLDRHLSA